MNESINLENESELTVVVKETGLEPIKTELLVQSFTNYYQEAKKIVIASRSIEVTDESQVELMAQARAKRFQLRDIRVAAEKTRKELKEQSLREGKAIDGIANVIKSLIIQVEDRLEKQEKFAEIKEAERKAARYAVRLEAISAYCNDPSMYNIREMEDSVFNLLHESLKKAFEDQKAAEAQAEAERIAKEKSDRQEAERMRKENEELKKQAEEREKKAAEERAKAEAKLKAEREAREKAVAEERMKAEKARKDQEEVLKKERAAKARIEAELKAKRDADEKRAKLEAEEKRSAALAPDKEKLLAFADQIELVFIPHVIDQVAVQLLNQTTSELRVLTANLRRRAKEL